MKNGNGLIPRILLDVHCQRDRLLARGAWCVPAASTLNRKLRELFGWAALEQVPLISINALFPNQNPWPHRFPPHCLYHTSGARRPRFAVLPNHTTFSSKQSTDLPVDLFDQHQQAIFETTTMNPFHHTRLDRLLSQMAVGRIYVIGVGLEGAVRDLVLGLLCRNKPVTLVEDAIASDDPSDGEFARRMMRARGAMVCTIEDLVGSSAQGRSGRTSPKRKSSQKSSHKSSRRQPLARN